MSQQFDVIVVGLGAMGSSTVLELARKGQRVLGIDRWVPPHTMGSSHGKVRLTRQAYYEHPLYVPLARRAREKFDALPVPFGASPLVVQTGALMLGEPDSEMIQGTLKSARLHNVPHELVDADHIRKRWRMYEPFDEMVGVYEPGGALLMPERIVLLNLNLARESGAEIVLNEQVVGWDQVGEGVEIRTATRTVSAGQLVLSAGAWNTVLLREHNVPLHVERQYQQWWEPARHPEWFTAGAMPVTMWELHDNKMFYAMTDLGDGVKIAWHHQGEIVDPEQVKRETSLAENASLTDLLRRFMPHAKGERLASEVCLYTNTPDGHFIIDRLPACPQVLLISACSGHGFKFSSAIGEVAADLLTTGSSSFDVTPFSLKRFS